MDHGVNDIDVVDSGGGGRRSPIIEVKQEVDVEFDEVEETMEFGSFGKDEETDRVKLEEEELEDDDEQEEEEVVVKLEPKQEMFDEDKLQERHEEIGQEVKKEIGMGSGGGELKDPLQDEMMSPQLQLQPTPMLLLTLHISKETRANPSCKEIEIKAVPIVDPRKTTRNVSVLVKAVPECAKDVKYYERCAKNAAATARTRQIKRIKMRQLTVRVEFLVKACNELQNKIQAVKSGRPINIANLSATITNSNDDDSGGGGDLSRQILKLENIYNKCKEPDIEYRDRVTRFTTLL